MFIQKFSRRDLGFAVLTGWLTGAIAWQVFNYLKVDFFNVARINILFHLLGRGNHHVSGAWLMLLVPILWILGVLLGYLLGQVFEFFNQFGKFAAIGFTNFAVNAAILNILLARTGYTSGKGYSLIVAVAFIIAVLSSYVWNKYWAFYGSRSGGVGEFSKFVIVTLVAFAVNIAVASFIVNFVHPILGWDAARCANVGPVGGSAVAPVVTFVGLKLTVLK